MDEETRITKFAQAFAKAQHWLAMAESNPLILQRIASEAKKELEIARAHIPESVLDRIANASNICTDVIASRKKRSN